LLAFWAWQSSQQDDISASQPSSLLQLVLNPSKKNAPKTIKPTLVHKPTLVQKKVVKPVKTKHNLLTRQASFAVSQQSVQSTPVNKHQKTTTKASVKQEHIGHQTLARILNKQLLSEKIQKQLNLRINFTRRYPRIAIRNAWEGRVSLGVRVMSDGQLTDIHVVNSSGYRILDNAALDSITRVANLPEARIWLDGRSIDVVLPVIYKLTDS